MKPKLVIFDCDGTLVDSQNAICASMTHAFAAMGLPAPGRLEILGTVGLSPPQALAALAPEQPTDVQAELVQLYRTGHPGRFSDARLHDPLFQGIREVVAELAEREDMVLGIATGKSRRGVARLLQREGWEAHFLTIQTADDHPSKPNPSMILKAIGEVGAEPSSTLMVGDTSFDIEMARSADVGALGVAWGYHPRQRLVAAGAHAVANACDGLLAMIDAQLAMQESVT